jgi:hypothetical protein
MNATLETGAKNQGQQGGVSAQTQAAVAANGYNPDHARGYFDEILSPPVQIKELVSKIKTAAGWETGIGDVGSSSNRGFEARSIDVYGYDVERKLAVIQLRRAYKRRASHFLSVSKAYALIGIDGEQAFSHVLESSPRRLRDISERTPESVVEWAEKIIFGLKNESEIAGIKRQGDIALVPVKAIPKNATPVEESEVMFRGSHRLVGRIYKQPDGAYFVAGGRETRMLHTKHEHGAVFTSKGQAFRVVVGMRGDDPWWLSATLGD